MTLKIITPVNIADNTKLNSKEYLYDAKKGELYFLNQIAWHRFIFTKNLLSDYEKYMTGYDKRSLYEWLQSYGYSIDDIKPAIMAKAAAHVNVMRQTGKKTLNDIITQTKTVSGAAYIPGSSLKGVIRTSILYNLLNKNKSIQGKYWYNVKNDFAAAKAKRFYASKINNIIGRIAAQLETDLLHKLNLHDEKDKPIKSNNAVCSVMRGISISDSEYMTETIPTAILQKVDYSLINGKVKDHPLPIFRECILPSAQFAFQFKLDKTMTREIGINSVDELLKILQQYFDFINSILKEAFGRECSALFDNITEGNIYLGSNIGFLHKTLVMALAPSRREAVNFVRDILDINFSNERNKHDGRKDTKISPRTLKATRYNGKTMLMGVGRIYKNE